MSAKRALARQLQFRPAPFLLAVCCSGALLAILARPIADRFDEDRRRQAAERRSQRLTAELREAKQREEEARVARMNEILAGLRSDLEAAARAGEPTEEPESDERKSHRHKSEPFERPDGYIVSIDRRKATVDIDVGRGDHLRLGVRFRAFRRGAASSETRRRIGEIVVTEFIGDNLARARIIDEAWQEPLHVGDCVWSPKWSRRPEHILLVGEFDLDGDHAPDDDGVHDLVVGFGAVVDARLGPLTDYVIVARALIEHTGDNGQKLQGLARAAGVPLLTLDEPTKSVVGLPNPVTKRPKSDFRVRRPEGPSRIGP